MYETKKTGLNSREEGSEFAIFYCNNCFNISRDSLYFDARSLDHIIRFYSYFYLIIYLMHFTPHSFTFDTFLLYICIKTLRGIFSFIPDDALDWRKLGFLNDFHIILK